MLPDELISRLPTFKCAACKQYFEGSPWGIVKLYVNITAPSSLEQFYYGLCKDCYCKTRDNFGIPIRKEAN